LEPNKTAVIERAMRVLRIIWVLMLGTLGLYLFICHQFGDEIRAKAHVPLDTIRQALYLVAAVDVLVTYYTRKIFLSGNTTQPKLKPSNSDLLQDQPAYVSKYATAMIIVLALSESIGIFGLVLFLLGDTYQTLHIFISISAVSMFYYRPKSEEIKQLSNAMKNENKNR
jgi:hypothetical protein